MKKPFFTLNTYEIIDRIWDQIYEEKQRIKEEPHHAECYERNIQQHKSALQTLKDIEY